MLGLVALVANVVSQPTQCLLALLSIYRRRDICRCLFESACAEDRLLSGEVVASLELHAQPRAKSVSYPLPAAPMRCLGYFDDAFPAVLRTIPDPPLVLYVLGSLDWLGQPVVAIIGARRATALGRTSALAMATRCFSPPESFAG